MHDFAACAPLIQAGNTAAPGTEQAWETGLARGTKQALGTQLARKRPLSGMTRHEAMRWTRRGTRPAGRKIFQKNFFQCISGFFCDSCSTERAANRKSTRHSEHLAEDIFCRQGLARLQEKV